jgi:[NiFe] hydrogenase diaphorase moiety small subunit
MAAAVRVRDRFKGRRVHLCAIVNAKSGKLGDTDFSAMDKAANVCPVGVILPKRRGFAVPIGERTFDKQSIAEYVDSRLTQRKE